mgnify:CR=1 FL=1
MKNKINNCAWCGRPTMMPRMQVADMPIMEWMEKKIDKAGRLRIWGEKSDWSKVKLDPSFEAELLLYDNVLSTVSSKTVCANCLVEDERLYQKYYGGDDEDIEVEVEDDGGLDDIFPDIRDDFFK